MSNAKNLVSSFVWDEISLGNKYLEHTKQVSNDLFLSVSNLCRIASVVWHVECVVWALLGFGRRLSIYGEFDPGSGRTLAACLTHASRTMISSLLGGLVANG
jgi:hypothetical protein